MRGSYWFVTAIGMMASMSSMSSMSRALTVAPPDATAPASSAAIVPPASPDETAPIQFSFSGASYREVIDFFSRATGRPVIWETDPPSGTLDYISPEQYGEAEALRVLNIILQSRGVMLRVSDDMLYLQNLTEMSKENIPTFVGEIPGTVTDDQIVTVVRPLDVAVAKTLGEKLASMVASYGSVTPMDQQNSLVIVETAAQVRRLLTIIDELDREDPEGVIEIFPVREARAQDLMVPLEALLAIKVERFIINKDGKQVRISDESMPGLNITADPRTNSIIAKGTQQRIDKLREVLTLLDVKSSGTSRTVRTFELGRLTPAEAALRVRQLYPENVKNDDGPPPPTIVPAKDAPRLTIVGTDGQVSEAEALLREIDDLAPVEIGDRTVAVVAMADADPAAAANAVRELLDRRQMRDLKLLAGPDGRSVLLAGPSPDVEAAKRLLAALDQPDRRERQIRVLAVTGDEPSAIVDRSLDLARMQMDEDDASSFVSEFDAVRRTLTLVGPPGVLDDLEAALRMVESGFATDRVSRYVSLENARPSQVTKALRSMADRLFPESDRSGWMTPTIEPIDDLDMIVLRATTAQLDVLDAVIRNLDQPASDELPSLRILQLRAADAANLANTLSRQYDMRPANERRQKPVRITADEQTNALVVAADESLLPEIQRIVDDLNDASRLDYEGREIRIFPLKIARAEELARTIDDMYPEPPMPRDRRGRPMPQLQQPREVVVRADPQTNSLIVDASVQRMSGFEQLVAQLDRQKIIEASEVRTYQIVHANLDALATTLRTLAANGSLNPSGRDMRIGISITTEPMSQSLVVSGPVAIFDRVEDVLEELDTRLPQPPTVLRFYSLEFARAESIADMLRSLLLARLPEDVPDAGVRGAALLNVTAENATNTLILSAPEPLIPVAEALIEQLDVEGTAAGAPTIRIRPLTFADARQVSDALMTALPGMTSSVTGNPVDVRLIPAPGSNALLLVGLDADLDEVEALIEPLDARPALDAIDARTFRLTHAEAATIAPLVQNLLTDQQATDPRLVLERIRRSRGQVDLSPRIRVEADQRTNSLIVSGPQQTVALAETLIGKLDQPADDDDRIVQLFTPTRARPVPLADRVRDILRRARTGGDSRTLELIAKEGDASVVVIGTRDDVDDALAMLEDWDDRSPVMPGVDLRIITLNHTDARVMANTLSSLLRDRARWPETLRLAMDAGVPIAQPTVTADAARNVLLVSAPTTLMPLADELVAALDHGRGDDAVDMKLFTLEQVDADTVAAALQRAEDARAEAQPAYRPARIVAERSSNTVIVTAAASQLADLEESIRTLDSGISIEQAQVRTVFLEHARADSIASTLRDLMSGEDIPLWMRFEAIRRNVEFPGSGPDVRISADDRLNAILLSAPPVMLNMLEEMVVQLDVDPSSLPGAAPQRVQVMRIVNADARELAQSLNDLFENADDTAPAPMIRVDAPSNTLLIRATDEQFVAMQRIAREVDAATINASRQMQMIPIDPAKANAADVARTLKQMLERGGAGVEVMTVEELLQRRDTNAPMNGASSSSRQWRDAPLALAFAGLGIHPRHPVPAVTPIATPTAPEDETGEPSVTIAVDPRTNSLVVLGAPRSIDRVRALAEQLEGQFPSPGSRVRYIPMPENVDARTVSRLIVQSLRQFTPANGRRGEVLSRISIVSDDQANAMLVTATDHDFELVGDLIAAMAQPAMTDRLTVKVYPLRTISAERAQESILNLLNPGGGNRGGRQSQRMRQLALTLLADEQRVEAVFDPSRIRVTTDMQNNAVIVVGDATAIEFVDTFVSMIDQTPVNTQSTLQLYPLRAARANDIERTLRQIFQARFRNARDQRQSGVVRPEFASDERTNTLLVTASPEYLQEVEQLLDDLDRELGDDRQPLRVVELKVARADQVARLLDRVIIGNDQERRASTQIVPDAQSGVIMIRAADEIFSEMETVLAEVDRDASAAFDVRTVTLERADANAVATALQRFYDDRARIASSGRGRRGQSRRVSIIGDSGTSTVLVAASNEDFEEIEALIQKFDSPQATDALSFRVFQLQHAKASEIESTVRDLIDDLTWNQGPVFFRGAQGRGTLAIRADARLNALIATGEGDKFEIIREIIDVLDAPPGEGDQRIVRLYRLQNVDLDVVRQVAEDVFNSAAQARRWWEPPDPTTMRIRVDRDRNTLVVAASAREHEDLQALIDRIDTDSEAQKRDIIVVPVQFADAREIARNLTQFLRDRARATNTPESAASVFANASSNSLIVSAGVDDLLTIRDLVQRLDRADVSGDRTIEIIALEDGDADEITRIIREQFGRLGGKGVIVTPDIRTNSLIVNAPPQEFAQARALIEQLDTPSAADETVVRTYTLDGARAGEIVDILSQTLQLNARGETSGITIKVDDDGEAVEVNARIVADARSNSLVVTATAESIPVIESLIDQLDDVPSKSPVDYRILPLEFAMADDVAFTLDQMVRATDDGVRPRIDYNRRENQLVVAATADQFEQIQRIVKELDQPSENERITDFVPLEFAEAVQVKDALTVFYGPMAIEADTPGKWNVRIVADPATNSLVISAAENEWPGIRALLAQLDSEEYDSSLQLQVLPLRYADATSVARAINDAFRGSIERNNDAVRGNDRRDDDEDNRRDRQMPTVLVEAEEWVRASAEPMTNSVVVSAGRQNIRKIERIVAQLDVADFARLPAPRLIPVRTSDPEQLAASLRELYERTARRDRSERGLRIVGDKASNTIIVRAEEDEFIQINALADALQQQTDEQGLGVHVIHLEDAPAGRVAAAIRQAYSQQAEQAGQSLSIDVDAAGNNLIIACSRGVLENIRATVAELDRLTPAAGQSIFIIELEHVSPEAAREVIRTIGLDQPQPDDSVAKLVTEPIRVTTLTGRNALVIVANPADEETIVALLKSIDAEPDLAESVVRVVALTKADVGAVERVLREMFTPGDQQANTPLARAVQEQVRRLSVRRDGLNEADLALDLTRPIRLVAQPEANALIVSSTEANVRAIEEFALMLDELAVTTTVTVQLFPLENIAASQFATIVREMFAQGKALGRVPGTNRQAMPGGIAGRALLDEVAISVDERTNTVIVAGKEEAVALVDVLSQRIDSDMAAGWVEPRLLPLRFADATDLAETLQAILVEGTRDLPQAMPLQRQVARLRMARIDDTGGRVLEADVFTPMSRLIIRPEPQLNALMLVGTPANIDVVAELVEMLDVEAASPSAVVRVYPIEHASAARLATVIARLFDEQVQSKAIRPEDRVVVQAEERTNALIVTTSPRSFAVLESLLRTLDAEVAPDLREIRRIAIENASATRLAAMIQELMDARLERLRRVQPETADLERATIVADTRTNSLVVAAGNDSFEVIRRLAADLDDSSLEGDALVQVLPMAGANIDRIADAVNAIMERRYADMPDDVRRSQRPLVLTDPRTNALLLAANPEDTAAIRELVEQLDAAPVNPAVAITVLEVPPTTNANELADRLERLMREREQTLGDARTPADRVTIEADASSNSLIVAANAENLTTIESLIEVLGGVEAEAMRGRDVEIVSLSSSRATDIVDLLEELYIEEKNRILGEEIVRATADERLNAVLLKGRPDDIRAMRDIVGQLDGAKPASVVEIRFIALASANALETVSLVENILSGRGIGRGRTEEQATVLRYLREIGDATGTGSNEIEVSAAIRESITLTPDLRTNTVIVSAPRESIDMIEQMIRDLDSTSLGAKNIRIFKLVNADATAMAEIITDLFSLRQQDGLNVLRPRENAPDGEPLTGTMGLEGVELTTVPDERQQLSITVDTRTNSLLVSGAPRYLDLVDEVVTELDALEANEREVFVYQLRNAVADEVARVIGDFVDQEQEKLLNTVGIDQLGSAARLLEREITIQGDTQSNTVLVSASPRYMATVKEMISQLDVDPPQVLIQVLLAEVTLDTGDEWGVDAAIRGQTADATIGAGFGFASAFVTGMGVPNLSIVASDFELMIRAMQEQGRLQVLSNPSIMAANNVPASLQVGETIRVPEGTFRNELGQTSTDLIAEPIGVILEVTPSINPDGFVRMDIRPEISSLSDRTTQVSEDFESPIITRREAQTIVTVRDGQTIVIAGLISDRFENRIRKVPLLGDIPLLGGLFRSEITSTSKTELLIVLTPYVVDSPTNLDAIQSITEESIDALTIPDDLKSKILGNIRDGTGGIYDATGKRLPITIDDAKPEGPPRDEMERRSEPAESSSYPGIDE